MPHNLSKFSDIVICSTLGRIAFLGYNCYYKDKAIFIVSYVFFSAGLVVCDSLVSSMVSIFSSTPFSSQNFQQHYVEKR